ncbi:MAG: PEGA domain-containing protein, partial [Bacteroidia bacterium]|nr:PEGA domain-containing protein [Bacteroidia bacterium]
VVEEISSQWLVIRPQPDSALIYVNDLFVKSGEYQAKVKPGIYDYRVEAPMYHSDAGKVEVYDAKKELNVVLNPAFGYIDLSCSPEIGATVIIDGKKQSYVTPFVSEPMVSGEHTLQVVKDMFQPLVKRITVMDGQTTPVIFTLTPNFAEVTITAPADAMLYVNNQQKGIGTWKGRLNIGFYSLEARMDKYRPAKQDIELAAGETRVFDLQPTPLYGSLDVMTTPSGATITINQKDSGTTPNTVNKLLIGDYSVQLSKTGYAPINKTVIVTEGKSTELIETLTNNKPATLTERKSAVPNATLSNIKPVTVTKPTESNQALTNVKAETVSERKSAEPIKTIAIAKVVTINSSPLGATLLIDGKPVGRTPYSGSLSFGSHLLKIEKDGKMSEETVVIAQSGGESNFILSIAFSATDMDGNVYEAVKIGTQVWMVENLKTTKYNDGTDIPKIADNSDWSKLTTPGYCFYNNFAASKKSYGTLYNWYTVNTGKLAPRGWHVPTDAEWNTLENYLIANGYNYDGTTTEDRIAKSLASITSWSTSATTGAIGCDMTENNSTGFEGLPAGYRNANGTFNGIGGNGNWWSTTEDNTINAWHRNLYFGSRSLGRNNFSKQFGFSV